MPTIVIRTRRSPEEVLAVLRGLPKTIKSRSPASQRLLTRTGLAALQVISQAFLVKSRGGTDAAGLRWAPLAPSTIAIRSAKKRPRPGPSPRTGLYDIMRESGELLVSLLPGARPDSAPISPPRIARQVFRVNLGYVTLGTSRRWAKRNHEGRPPSLPRRRLWPSPNHWPMPWWDRVLRQAQMGVVGVIVEGLV